MGCAFSSSLASVLAIMEQYMHIDNNIGSLIVSLSVITFTGIYEISENVIDDKNSLFYICINFISIIIALLTLLLIWSSKLFINSESFTLKPIPNIECTEYKFEDQNTCEYNQDTFCSNGSYQPRDTSIVSIMHQVHVSTHNE